MITTTSKLPQGAVFYLPENPGNTYRNLDKGRAEFIEHRLGPQYRGCVVTVGVDRMVATDPGDRYPEPCTLCGAPVTWNEGLCDSCHEAVEADQIDLDLL